MPRSLRPVLLLTLALALVATGLGRAGFDPTPFQPEINQLRAVENVLYAHFDHLDAVLSMPPDDILPDPALVGQLDAIARQVANKEVQIVMIVDPVLAIPPDDILPPDLLPVMGDLEALSATIATRARAGFAMPPNDIHPDVTAALETVQLNSQGLLNTVIGTIGLRLYTMIDPCDLWALEPGTGATKVGDINAGVEALSFGPNGLLYATAVILYCGTHPAADSLITVDLGSGAGSLVGEIGPGDWDAMAFAPSGDLWALAAGASELWRLDPANGALVPGSLLPVTGGPFGFLGAIDFSPDGVLYAVDKFEAGGGPSTLMTIDLATGVATVIGELGVNSVTGISFTDGGTLYGVSDPTLRGPDGLSGGTGDLVVIDTATGAAAPVLHIMDYLPEDLALDGLAAVPSM